MLIYLERCKTCMMRQTLFHGCRLNTQVHMLQTDIYSLIIMHDKQMDFTIVILVYPLMSGIALAYLAADCQLSSEEGCRKLRSADSSWS